LFAARGNKRLVDMEDFEKAKDKIMMGAERRSMVMNEDERRNTAYHESGHAVVAKLMPKSDPVHKVTIIPRGRALGLTMQLPEEDRYAYDRVYLMSRIAVLFGGRIAEELFMNQMTTGASNDFERATQMARDMVTRYGMSDALGPMVYGENEGEVFLGRSVTTHKNMSEATMEKVDAEIRRIIDEQYGSGAPPARRLIATRSRPWPQRCSNSKRSTRPDQRHHGRQATAATRSNRRCRPPNKPDHNTPDAAPSATAPGLSGSSMIAARAACGLCLRALQRARPALMLRCGTFTLECSPIGDGHRQPDAGFILGRRAGERHRQGHRARSPADRSGRRSA
jgi:hypothetical protein